MSSRLIPTTVDAFERLIRSAEHPPDDEQLREGLQDTPVRAAKAWMHLTRGYGVDPWEVMTTFDADGYDEMVVLRDVPFHSLCEHHLLPFTGTATLGYIPSGRIAGLSKLARLVTDVYAPRLQNQERLTSQVADALEQLLEPKGAFCIVTARHLCMEMRGVELSGQAMVTSALRGKCQDTTTRAEVMALRS